MVKEIDKEEIKSKLDNNEDIILLDVRDTPEYNKEHIIGAKHLLISEMDGKAESKFNKDDTIITYSEDIDCPAKNIAAEKLEKMGFKNVMAYPGSWKDWKDSGYPME
ncbi:MAG: rhodanese-like domain-containing protein [Candidatus Lokiarchaeota archaeon]|nr:rhodanese-like domain-containing protein [Candidatus Lokiarchaeota archaeon]